MDIVKKLIVDEEVDLSIIPVRIVRRGSKVLGIYLIIFAIIFGGFPLFMLIWSVINNKFEPAMMLMIIPFVVMSLGIALYAVNQLVKEVIIDIDYDTISMSSKSLFKKSDWKEASSSFKGILFKTEQSGEKSYYTIELNHPDDSRSIVLARYLFGFVPEAECREKWEEYSRQLKLPALEETGEGMQKREPGDLNKSVRDLVREDKISVQPNSGKVPDDFSHSLEQGSDVITIEKRKGLNIGVFIILFFAAILVYIGFFASEEPDVNLIVLGCFGALLGGYTILYTIWFIVSRQQVRCRYESVHILYRIPFGHTSGKKISGPEIEELVIDKGMQNRYEALFIRTDRMRVKVAEGVRRESLEWLKDYITLKISAG